MEQTLRDLANRPQPEPQDMSALQKMADTILQWVAGVPKGIVMGESGQVGPSPQNIGALLGALPIAAIVGGAQKLARVAKPIKAFHGSPHDFDQFSLSKIGTGEGAQAYGHGLYFAENEGVAKSYRDTLVDRTQYTRRGKR